MTLPPGQYLGPARPIPCRYVCRSLRKAVFWIVFTKNHARTLCAALRSLGLRFVLLEAPLGAQVLALWGLAHAQRDGGRYFDAAASFQAVAALRPTQWGAHLHAAVCAVLLGKPPGGRERALADMQAAALKVNEGARAEGAAP